MATDSSSDHLERVQSGARRKWFPIAWTLVILVGCAGLWVSGLDRDVKNFFTTLAVPVLFAGLSIWFLRSSGFSRRTRYVVGLFPWVVAIAFGSSIQLLNNGDVGIIGWRWRWAAKPDQQLEIPITQQVVLDDWQPTEHDYPRFLGSGPWAEVTGVELETDWQSHPPEQVWRAPVGAAWSAFAIVGNYAVTQEQRDDKELVTCYRVDTDKPDGEIVWTHADPVRFDPSGTGGLGGVGPRATPTIHDGRVYTMGATGIVNCLDARTGELVWSHDTLSENGAGNLNWGKASSPLVVERDDADDLLVVSVGGANNRSLVAYNLASGQFVWGAGNQRSSYASPIVVELAGERQIVSVNESNVTGHRIEDGAILWAHPWDGDSDGAASTSQPMPVGGDRILLSKGYNQGASLLQLSHGPSDTIQVTPVWTPAIKQMMKTKMCNVVVRDGYAYGLDGGILECMELETGKRMWKKRRSPAIGHGQIMLVGDAILALSETGELILVAATPEAYTELASIRVLPTDQITWNNPAFSPPYLLVRNAQEAACYRMQLRNK